MNKIAKFPLTGIIVTAVGLLVVLPGGVLLFALLADDVVTLVIGVLLSGMIWSFGGGVTGWLLGQYSLMAGGQMVMAATNANDQWDVRKADMAAKMFGQGVALARSQKPQLPEAIEAEWEELEMPELVPFGSNGR